MNSDDSNVSEHDCVETIDYDAIVDLMHDPEEDRKLADKLIKRESDIKRVMEKKNKEYNAARLTARRSKKERETRTASLHAAPQQGPTNTALTISATEAGGAKDVALATAGMAEVHLGRPAVVSEDGTSSETLATESRPRG